MLLKIIPKIGFRFAFMNKIKNSLLCFFTYSALGLFLMVGTSFITVNAQPIRENVTRSLELQVASLEQSYDTQIIQILSNYFDHRKFFVDVNIDAEMVSEVYSTTQNQIRRAPQPDIMMPGLPFLPEENRVTRQLQSSATETVINENTVRTLRIKQIQVDVFADSSFSSSQLGFMKLIAGIAAKTNEARGDRISISQLVMPNFGFDSPSPAVEIKQPEPKGMFASLEQYVPGLILLILVALMLLINRFTDKPKVVYPENIQRNQLKAETDPAPVHTNNDSINTKPTAAQKAPENPIDLLTNHFFNRPKEIALLFEYWLEEDGSSGAKKAAEVVCSVDKHVIKSLKSELEEEDYRAILNEIKQLAPQTFNEKIAIAREFNSTFLYTDIHSSSFVKHQQLNLFKFLAHITDEQITRLLEGESSMVSALVIDYLPEDRSTKVFELLDRDRSAAVMLGMTKLNALSYQDHKEISSRLFDKAMQITEEDREQKSGTDQILPILEKLPVAEQETYIEELKAMGSPAGSIIQKQFITIQDIPQLDKDLLQEALAPLETQTLVAALSDLDSKIADAVLSVRPSREQRLIRMEIQQGEEQNAELSNKAKDVLMGNIRRVANQYRGL